MPTATPTPIATAACSSEPAGWTPVGAMARPRAAQSATLLRDGKVLVAGGDDGSRNQPSAELFDPASGQWLQTGAMAAGRSGHSATLLGDGKVIVVGGLGTSADVPQIYDPGAGTWTAGQQMTHGRSGHTATLLDDGTVLVVGGIGGIGAVASGAHTQPAEIYDPAGNRWTPTGPMTLNRVGHTATLLADGRVLVAGGMFQSGGQPRSSSEVYAPASGTWTATGEMQAARTGHTAIRLADGSVIVAGGLTSNGEQATTIDRYDPSTGRWSVVGNIEFGAASIAAVLLCDGTVLFSGGPPVRLDVAQIYDPHAGAITQSGPMTVARELATLTVLRDNRVLLVGGRADGGDPVDAAEVYGPLP